MTWKNTTLQGLDEALKDLQKAIDNLPEGAKKSKLMERFQKLQHVRQDLTPPGSAKERDFKKHLLLFGVLLLVGFGMLFIILRREHRYFIGRHR